MNNPFITQDIKSLRYFMIVPELKNLNLKYAQRLVASVEEKINSI